MSENKDILIFMSDQHTPYFSGFFAHNVDTPNMDKLCEEGTRFDNCVTSSPLCVPARNSMLSTLYPHKTGVLTNSGVISNLQPTFLQPFVVKGYETVLCGRMHFIGEDQRHGFTKRIAEDITPVGWGRPESLKFERGVHATTFWHKGATAFAGAGASPVLTYDDLVISKALEYLSQPHDKPQLIVVSVYGPHFPYVAPVDLYKKYLERVKLPRTFYSRPSYNNKVLNFQTNEGISEEKELSILAAYSALVELTDTRLGQVVKAFEEYEAKKGEEGYVAYISDHGDQCGDRSMYGKSSFFEKSVKIPFIIKGPSICKNKVSSSPCSIMDLGPTLCDLTGTEKLIDSDGVSLYPVLVEKDNEGDKDRVVYSEIINLVNWTENVYAMMALKGKYKYISYYGMNEILFDMEKDEEETTNIISDEKEVADEFRKLAKEFVDPEKVIEEKKKLDKYIKWYKAYEDAVGLDESERWKNTDKANTEYPEICVK